MVEQNGGAYRDLWREGYDAHHLLAWESYRGVLGITHREGPSILMSREDHRATESWGRGGKDYRLEQRAFLEQGKVGAAWMMEIDSLRNKFGTKYDEHIIQAEKQLLKLEEEKKITLEKEFKVELKLRQEIQKGIEQKESRLKEIEATKESERNQKVEQEQKIKEREIEEYRKEIELKKIERERALDKTLSEYIEKRDKLIDPYGERPLTRAEYLERLDKNISRAEIRFEKKGDSFSEQPVDITFANGNKHTYILNAPREGWSKYSESRKSLIELIKIQKGEEYLKYLESYQHQREIQQQQQHNVSW